MWEEDIKKEGRGGGERKQFREFIASHQARQFFFSTSIVSASAVRLIEAIEALRGPLTLLKCMQPLCSRSGQPLENQKKTNKKRSLKKKSGFDPPLPPHPLLFLPLPLTSGKSSSGSSQWKQAKPVRCCLTALSPPLLSLFSFSTSGFLLYLFPQRFQLSACFLSPPGVRVGWFCWQRCRSFITTCFSPSFLPMSFPILRKSLKTSFCVSLSFPRTAQTRLVICSDILLFEC